MPGAGFLRRFDTDPGIAELLAIEGVVVIDREPTSPVQGQGTGFVTCIGEFEDGDFNTPLEHISGDDLLRSRGGFGYVYDGVVSNNPSARSRKADGALKPEYWNGNGFIALVNKRYARLATVRVDTTVGYVNFTRLASSVGNNFPFWNLEPAQTLSVNVGAGASVATFNATAAVMTSTAGTYPPSPTLDGKSMTVIIDDGQTSQIGPVQIFFQSTDTTQNLVIARINSFLGYTAAVNTGGNVTTLTGRIRGLGGNVKITAIHADVATATGFSATTATGTGNVQNIDSVALSEVEAIVETAVTNSIVDRDANGNIRISSANGAFVEVGAASTATAFGFTLGVQFTAVAGVDGVIPAGTRVRDSALHEWVTAQSIAVIANSVGPYTAKIRPAVDDGTGVAALTGAVNVVPFPIPVVGAFTVSNPLPIAAALSEAAIDAAYVTALDTTLNSNLPTKDTNIIFSARQSNIVRNYIRNNALTASTESLSGRVGVIRPPLSTTTRALAISNSQPGVGVTRSQNVFYGFPGAATYIPQIAQRGLAGGAGFTADGIISVGFDSWIASVCSQIKPEEDPGELTPYMNLISGFELDNPDIRDMKLNDYKAFKRAGIMALRFAEGTPIIQSGVTSVDPAVFAALVPANRRRFSYFVEDSLAVALSRYSKKVATKQERSNVYGVVSAFLRGLQSPGNPSTQRLEAFSIDAKTPNTPETLAAGIFRLTVKVRMLPVFLSLVLDVTVGAGVTVDSSAAPI